MTKFWAGLMLLVTLMGCASLADNLQQVRAGMDKDEVLRIAGSPKFTFRENSQDHWAYFYFSNDKEWRRDIVFEAGKVIRVTKPITKEKWQRSLDGARNMQEYEQIVREHQRTSAQFVPLDGSP